MRCPLRKQYTFFFVGRFFWTLYHAACLGDAKMTPTSFGMAPIPRRRTFVGNARVHPRTTARAAATLSHDEIRRYARHLVLSDVGMAGQAALKDAAVLVIGAGGLGSPALLYLAAAGVGHVGIVDADAVDESNLQRQIIHRMTTLGRSKCQSARQAMNELNPLVEVRLFEEEFTSQSAPRIVGDGFAPEKPWDIIIDGSDNFPTKYLINDVCAMYGLPWVYSAILAFEGQLSVFNVGDDSPDYRDLLPVPPNPGDVPSCAEGGVLGVLPGTMGCLQATEAIKYILGHRSGLLVGRVLIFDALAMTFSHVGLQRSLDREPITELIDYQGFCAGPKAAASSPLDNVNGSSTIAAGGRTMDEAESATPTTTSHFHAVEPKDCFEKLCAGWTPWVLDVRLPTEHAIVHLPFTDRVVPHRQVRVTDIPTTGDVLIYCKGGVRGAKACAALIDAGVPPERLYNLQGGIMQWQKDIDPSMPRY